MLGKSRRGRPSDMVHAFFVEQLIPPGHILRRLDAILDTRWVRDEVRSTYAAKTGRPSWDPEVIVRMMLLGFLYGFSDVQLCDEVRMHFGYRWFCFLSPSDEIPDRTTLVKLRNDRWQQDLWLKILDTTVAMCVEAGLLRGRHVALDGTTIQANAAITSMEAIAPPLSLQDYMRRRMGSVKFIPPETMKANDSTPKSDAPRRSGSADEAKGCHGLGRIRWRGRAKVNRQVLMMTATVINLKRLVVYLGRRRTPANVAANGVKGARLSVSLARFGLWAALVSEVTRLLLGDMGAPACA